MNNDIANINKAPEGWTILVGTDLKTFIEEQFGDDGNRNILGAAQLNDSNDDVFAILELQEVGYVSHPQPPDMGFVMEKGKEDLQIMNSENGFSDAEKVRWKGFNPPPRYDAANHTLEYGVELYFGHDPASNLYRIMLIRTGALIFTQVGKPKNHLSYNGWQININPNYAYNKFQAGKDRRSESNLQNLILMNRFV